MCLIYTCFSVLSLVWALCFLLLCFTIFHTILCSKKVRNWLHKVLLIYTQASCGWSMSVALTPHSSSIMLLLYMQHMVHAGQSPGTDPYSTATAVVWHIYLCLTGRNLDLSHCFDGLQPDLTEHKCLETWSLKLWRRDLTWLKWFVWEMKEINEAFVTLLALCFINCMTLNSNDYNTHLICQQYQY